MPKRRAFVGLSSPLAYDYKPKMQLVHPRDRSAPNPILEDAMGLLLFYDELIFLSRHLCPANMRSLEYVSFLTDREDFHKKFPSVQDTASNKEELHPLEYDDYRWMMDGYKEAISTVTGLPTGSYRTDEAQFFPDNHTHGIFLKDEIVVRASPTDFKLMCLDWEILSQFNLEDCDPVCNSANAEYYRRFVHTTEPGGNQVGILQHIIAKRIPNYLGTRGPYHPSIEDLRRNRFLEDLRSYLDDLVSNGSTKEIAKIAAETERLANEYKDRIFREHLTGRNEYYTVGKAVITGAVGLAIPGVGVATELVESYLRKRQRDKMRWAGFIAELPKATNS